jgi:hypothetical protein
MSKYPDNNELFLEAKTTQYGPHMVMTNVMKPMKKKYINIDTRFRDEYNPGSLVNYNITLPERITEVKSIHITNIEIPNSIYNISASIGNNAFKVTKENTNVNKLVVLPDGHYATAELLTIINQELASVFSTDISGSILNNKFKFTANTYNYDVDFTIDETGNFNKYSPRSKLGWTLGFHCMNYTIQHGTSMSSESFIDLNGPRYLYLAIDEFTKGNQHSFISPLTKSFINKNIVARITIDNTTWGFGKIIPANMKSGNLVSDHRSYTGKTDLQKLNIQILNEFGHPVDLNGMDFSFCIEVEHE